MPVPPPPAPPPRGRWRRSLILALLSETMPTKGGQAGRVFHHNNQDGRMSGYGGFFFERKKTPRHEITNLPRLAKPNRTLFLYISMYQVTAFRLTAVFRSGFDLSVS
ncbi:hypothetical protein F4809DRAFT_620303 [Biscogniauxia mediterranea]|nr:hypothetical protein F4809DRAFT_620303 [Biscogniauxia mediterranea]